MSPSQDNGKGAAEYGREALAQWREAAHFGIRALAERKKEKQAAGGLGKASDALGDGEPEAEPKVGSELGELADAALAKLGKGGRLAAKAGVGRRFIDRLVPGDASGEEDADEEDAADEEEIEGEGEADGGEDPTEDHFFDDAAPIPIQESIDVAVPVAAAFELCTHFEELSRFSERIREVSVEGDERLALLARIGGRERELVLEIVGEEPEERIDWEGVEGFEHAGVVSFHPLAPRLTRIELTIERDSEGIRERALRAAGLPERAIRQELRRFKAYAELWDEANDYKSADFKDPASEEADERDEADEDQAPADEAEPEEGDDEEPLAEEEELEAAA